MKLLVDFLRSNQAPVRFSLVDCSLEEVDAVPPGRVHSHASRLAKLLRLAFGHESCHSICMAINEPSDSLPLADVFRAANELVATGLIEDWALGGALAAIYYVEPFTTYDADIFFIPKEKGLTAGVPA